MPNFLAIDSSTDRLILALEANGKRYLFDQATPRTHTDHILPEVQRLLKDAAIQLGDLSAILTTIGPGRFIGVRLACTVAQGLAYAANVPLIAVSTLQAMAQTEWLGRACEQVRVYLGAKKSEYYTGVYVHRQGVMVLDGKEQLQDQADIVDDIDEALYPAPEALLALAANYYQQEKFTDPLHLEPNYIRQKVTD